MNIQSYFLNEIQIIEHFFEMEKRFKRFTEKEKRFFPSIDYFINDETDKLSRIKSQVDEMTNCIGLGSLPNKIKIEKLNNAAAIINLSESSFIDITIDEDVYNNNDFYKIFGTLAHELGHKILKSSGLFYNGLLDIENEIYADLSTFYLGFGKFVLNGYNIIGNSGTRTGYLTPETYVMAYVISEYLNGREPDTAALPKKIIDMVSKAKSQCRTRWIKDVINEENIKEQYKGLSIPIGTTATILEILRTIQENESTKVRYFITRLNDTFIQNSNNTPLDYRKVALANATFLENKDDNSFLGKSNLDKLIKLIAFIISVRGYNLDKLLDSIKHRCPDCGIQINNPAFNTEEGKRIYHIRCNKCQTQFVVNNDISEIKELIQRNISFYQKLISNNKEGIVISSVYNDLKNSYINTKQEEIKDDKSLLIDSLQKQVNRLEEEVSRLNKKETEWKSLNWWQRLWYRKD